MGRSGAPAIGSPKTITPPPFSGKLPKRARQLRRRIKSPPFRGGRRNGPPTPHLSWKLNDADWTVMTPEQRGQGGKGLPLDASANPAGPATAFSARKLAAALWHLREVDSEPNPRYLHLSNVFDHDRTSQYPSIFSNELVSSIPISPGPKATLQKLEASAAFLSVATEKATKWDAGCLRSAQEAYSNRGHLKLHKDPSTTASVISVLQAELEQSRYCIHKLKNENESAKKKLEHLLKKLADEKASWRSREHEKVRNIIQVIKHDLDREKKSRKRMETVNSKLVNELAEAKLSAKQYLQDYEKERKARELIEEVCDGLTKEMGDDRAEVEALKRESIKIREEMDEERRMLQMAEVWREERVQMKLVDAKITLEEKYAELSNLQDDLDTFLRLHSSTDANVPVLREAEALRESIGLLKFQDIVFRYQPPPSTGDIFSVFEEFHPEEAAANDKKIDQCCGYSSASNTSKIHTASPETDIFLENPTMVYENDMINRNEDAQDDSGLETMSFAEGQGSCNSPEGSNLSANGRYEESRLPSSAADWDLRRESHSRNSEGGEVCSRTTGQPNSRKQVSAIGKFWWSSGNNKKSPVQVSDGKHTNRRMLIATMSPDMNSGEVDSSSPSVCLQRPSDSVKQPDIGRGAKGCTEWPTETEDRSLKKKLLEARMESDRFQLRHVLKHVLA